MERKLKTNLTEVFHCLVYDSMVSAPLFCVSLRKKKVLPIMFNGHPALHTNWPSWLTIVFGISCISSEILSPWPAFNYIAWHKVDSPLHLSLQQNATQHFLPLV